MNSKLRKQIAKKSMARHKWSKFGGSNSWNEFKYARNIATSIKRTSFNGYFHIKCTKGSPQSMYFWKTIKPFVSKDSFHGGADKIMLQDKGEYVYNDQDVCNIFNKQFCIHNDKVNSNDRDVDAYKLCLRCIEAKWKHSEKTFDFKKVNVSTVIQKIRQLGTNKATGFDDIPAKLIKTAAKQLAPGLTSIFNQCIDESVFPDDLKFANIMPAFKAKDPLCSDNYRPISILTVLSKVLEGNLNDQLITMTILQIFYHL
jgi:hypothetical protein